MRRGLSRSMAKMLNDEEYSQDRISLSRNKIQGPLSAFLEITFIGAHNDKSIQSQ
jgi:hypothetical protein